MQFSRHGLITVDVRGGDHSAGGDVGASMSTMLINDR